MAERHGRGVADPLAVAEWVDDAAEALTHAGWLRQPSLVPPAAVAVLAEDLERLIEADRLHRAGIARDHGFQVDRNVRRDWVFWLNRSFPAQPMFLEGCERLRTGLNRRLFLGMFEFEAHLALYPAGTFYRRHLDSFRCAANRVLLLVVYLNREWRPGDGNELVLYTPDHREIVCIEARTGTVMLFMSEEIEHEVLPTHAPGASIAGWFQLNNNRAAVVDPPG